MDNKRIAIIGGGTVSWTRSHLALSAPAYGTTARQLDALCVELCPQLETDLYLTRMAGGAKNDFAGETNEDVAALVDRLVADDKTRIIFFNAAMVDFDLKVANNSPGESVEVGKYGDRLSTHIPESDRYIGSLTPTEKVISRIRKDRKDIFLVGFKQTCGATPDEQYIAGLRLCKEASCNLVLANDSKTRFNMVVTPEESRYHETTDRTEALTGLVTMAKLRSHLGFTRSTVIEADPVKWDSELVPASLRKIVDYCIENNAYKPFNGSTAGHFAVKIEDDVFLTSQRRTNFNDLAEIGLVKVVTDGPDTVLAYGAKPSVGGQSQRIVFNDHPGYDCILHFHCPMTEEAIKRDVIPIMSQYEFECGSHECGQNTSKGLLEFNIHEGPHGRIKVVYLDNHGPNIVFNRNVDPECVIRFIQENFDLTQKTGGFVSVQSRLETPNTLDTAKEVL